MKQDYAINADYNIGDLSTNHSFLLNGKPVGTNYTAGDGINISEDNVISIANNSITPDKIKGGPINPDPIQPEEGEKIITTYNNAQIIKKTEIWPTIDKGTRVTPVDGSSPIQIPLIKLYDNYEGNRNVAGFARSWKRLYTDNRLEITIEVIITRDLRDFFILGYTPVGSNEITEDIFNKDYFKINYMNIYGQTPATLKVLRPTFPHISVSTVPNAWLNYNTDPKRDVPDNVELASPLEVGVKSITINTTDGTKLGEHYLSAMLISFLRGTYYNPATGSVDNLNYIPAGSIITIYMTGQRMYNNVQ